MFILLLSMSVYGQRNLSQSSSESGYPAIAVNQDGVILVVWPEGGHEAGTLYYSVFKNGQWSTPRNANITSLQAWSPQLDVDSVGNFHCAYADGNSRLNRDVFHCAYDPNKGWGSPERIWRSEENSAWQRIDIENDRIYIIWHHENSDPYTGHDILMQSKMVGDQFWPSAYERFSWTAFDNSTHPSFRVLNDKIYVVYMEGVGDSMPWRLFFKEGPRGSAWQTIPVEEVTPLGYRPDMEVDNDGNAHIVWSTKVGSFMYRQKANGVWKPAQVLSNMFADQQFGDIRYRNKTLVAAWTQHDSGGMSAYYAKKVIGSGWGKPVQITQGSSAYFPRIWLDDDGYAHFVWQDHGNIYYEKIAVPPPVPIMQLSKTSFSFTVKGANPAPATFKLKNIGEQPMNFTAASDKSWLSITPTSGRLTKNAEIEFTCSVDAVDMDEGNYTATIEITSPEALNSPKQVSVDLTVLAPPIYAPLNFSGEVLVNKALFYREYIHKLTWQANPDNKDIVSYRIYENDGVNRTLLAEVSSSTFEYTRRGLLDSSNSHTYEVAAVDKRDREGPAASVTLSGSSRE